MAECNIELGFLEICEAWQVESRLFPSKVGGKPAWLDLEKLPSPEQLECSSCHNSMIFLCQLYAPYEENIEESFSNYLNNFHRTIFVFVCRNSECSKRNNNGNLKVFRSSLQRNNKYYPYDPPEDKPKRDFSLTTWVSLCNLCGCLADKKCSKCKKAHYCSKYHQILDWKDGHKKECGADGFPPRHSKLLFPEWEIITDPEHPEDSEDHHTSVEEELIKFDKLKLDGKTGSMVDTAESDLDAHAATEKDKVFLRFQKRVEHNPDQVIRYKRGGEPLWIAKEPTPEKIPDCDHCNGPRQFEFQIMPQMLTYLKETEVDWGIVAVYTCKNSCTDNSSYKQEFVFKQDVAD